MVKQHFFLVAKFTQHKIYHCDHYKVFDSMHLVHSQCCAVNTSPSSKIFSSSKKKFYTQQQSLSIFSSTLQLLDLSLWIYPFFTLCIHGIIQYMTFCIQFLSFSIMFSKFIHGVACISASFLFITQSFLHFIYLFIC